MNPYVVETIGQDVAYACHKCQKRYSFKNLSVRQKARELAESCCRNGCCAQCGGKIYLGLGGVHCDQCIEFNTVKKAEHIAESDYKGRAVFTEDGPGGNEGYYVDSDLYDECKDCMARPPCYVYACNPVPFEPDVFAYIESEFETHTIGDADVDDFTDGEELAELCGKLSDWAAKQPVFYEVDTERVIVLDNERFQKYLQANDQKT